MGPFSFWRCELWPYFGTLEIYVNPATIYYSQSLQIKWKIASNIVARLWELNLKKKKLKIGKA